MSKFKCQINVKANPKVKRDAETDTSAVNFFRFAPLTFPSPRWGEGGVRGIEPNVKILSAFVSVWFDHNVILDLP